MNEISLNIENVIKNILPSVIDKGLDKAGYIVENDAKRKVGVKTATLRKSITHDVEDGTCYIGSNVEYAPYHHEKNPFLEDSIQENIQEIKDCFKGVLDNAE
ncbi:HK97 gp10 family phage protein [Anaerotignum propionicum]|uniref:Bacteriophage HK97-gp10, tail-component n=1 Tax=Anaerotignum propionicum DSM 1682 TaxID=991789 RepID=A0A0X8VC77_ANAPI|nr:HK97 gp10 family phage protein [Anaerotignum propionicum]AMJ42330.1 hypothetical protein CPRO_27840 [Anaerotignum propionicum DSM 1682]SHE99679.1 hypothetical protein SAMN02745151_02440 [[Clostridium] propionicum DSM 1682] [Anaerotignum propionicum DSM 1682]